MKRCCPPIVVAITLAVLFVAARREAIAQSSFTASGDKILVHTEPTQDAGISALRADCEINGGMLYIDRDYAGTVPYVGAVSPGRHYVEFVLPGYDNLGIWLTLEDKTKYSITFNPTGEISLFASNDRVSVSSNPTLSAGSSDLEIYCERDGGMLYIDQNYVGTTGTTIPYSGSISPGSHYLEIEQSGYRNLGIWIVLEEKTHYIIRFNPQRITGNLSIDVAPADASLSVDGAAAKNGDSEYPVGKHRLLARRFGYADQSLDIVVQEGATSSVSIKLEKAPFAISGIGFSRAAFNPRNTGAFGKTSINFRASSYGSARAEIVGPDGASVATLEYPDIEDWDQSQGWDGLGSDGEPLPDGVYTVRLVANPAPGVPVQSPGLGAKGQSIDAEGAIAAEVQVRIDSSIVIRPYGTASALPGLLYMPDPALQSAGTIAVEAFWFAPWDSPENSAFGLSSAMSLGGSVTLDLHASAETAFAAKPFNAGDLAASALVSLFGDAASAWSGAFFVRGGYSSAAAPSMPGAESAVEASLPLAARVEGPSKLDLRLALAPGGRADFSSPSPAYLGLVRAAFWLEGSSFRAGLSGELPLSFSGGALFSSAWPAKAALEGRFILGSTPFIAAAYATAEFPPSSAPSFGIGLGLGLLF